MKLSEEDFIGMDEPNYSGWVLKLSENMEEAKSNFEQIIQDNYQAPLYDEFFDAVNMTDAIDIVKEWSEKAKKWDKRDSDRTNLLTESNTKYRLEIKGEKLLSEKRRTDGIEMLLEIKQLKEEVELAKGTPNSTLLENINLNEKLEKIKNASRKWQLAELDEILSPQEKK